MCRSTAAPLMAMVGMAGTAVGVAIAVLREKADRRSIEREVDREFEEAEAEKSGNGPDSEASDSVETPPEDEDSSNSNRT